MTGQTMDSLPTAWPSCPVHGRMHFRVNEPGNSYYECKGFDGEACDAMITLAAFEDWWMFRCDLPRGVDAVWADGSVTTSSRP